MKLTWTKSKGNHSHADLTIEGAYRFTYYLGQPSLRKSITWSSTLRVQTYLSAYMHTINLSFVDKHTSELVVKELLQKHFDHFLPRLMDIRVRLQALIVTVQGNGMPVSSQYLVEEALEDVSTITFGSTDYERKVSAMFASPDKDMQKLGATLGHSLALESYKLEPMNVYNYGGWKSWNTPYPHTCNEDNSLRPSDEFWYLIT